MGCDAEIIAIGPFSKRIAHALSYGEDQHQDVPEGATVITTVFETYVEAHTKVD